LSESIRWPDGKSAAIGITMDNMGEASEIYRGTWPDSQTIGRHRSVVEDLPNMLQVLEDAGVHATYFIEGWNTGVYRAAIQAINQRGHEIAFHGWQHEPWGSLEPDQERALFQQSLNGFASLNLRMEGLRPPGGMLTESTPSFLREFGFAYCSPAGSIAAIRDGIVYLPFEWHGIDAYYYSDAFAGLRMKKGDASDAMEPEILVDRVFALIDRKIEENGYTALLFHPFLANDDRRIDAMRQILDRVQRDDRIWCAPCSEVARWVREHPDVFGDDPDLDLTSWSR
jgi:peptidoglycan-N-acetylglucosamine deacetylase